MFPPSQDFYRLAPEIVLCATGALLMLVEPFLSSQRRRVAGVLALLGAVASLASAFYLKALPGKAFNGLLAIDGFSFFFHVLVGTVAALVILGSADYLEREQLRDCRDGRDGQRAGTGHGVHRPGDEFDFELHPGRLSQGRSQIERSCDEVFPAGFVCDGVFPVRNCAAVWRNGNDIPSANERFCSGSERDARAAGSGADLHWTGVQSRGGPISSVDTGCVRRRADTGHSVVLCR